MVSALQESALGYERSRWAAQLGPLLKLWGSLSPSIPNFAQLAVPSTGSPLDVCLASEVSFAQQLVASVSASLSSLSDLVVQSGVLTPQVQVRPNAINS